MDGNQGKHTSGKQTVLLVEDNDTYRKVVTLTVEAAGYEVMEAANGQIALDLCKNRVPDLVVSDIYMPEMDGLTLVKSFKAEDRLKAVSFVMLTNVQEEINHAVEFGADEAVLKSTITPTQVVEICRKYLE